MMHADSASDLDAEIGGPLGRLLDHGHAKLDHLEHGVLCAERVLSHACDVRVTHSFDLVDAILVRQHVKPAEQVCNEVNDFCRGLRGRQLREAAEVRLRNRGVLVGMGELGQILTRSELPLLEHGLGHQAVQHVLDPVLRVLHAPLRFEPGPARLFELVRQHAADGHSTEENDAANVGDVQACLIPDGHEEDPDWDKDHGLKEKRRMGIGDNKEGKDEDK
mmetsp:Transcript_63820/g.149874  ORF Transcript_63820/g.149874 Transcript_63820/m.149874 type:complete len:220 (-) Transcript_63820:2641-3300(-)